MSLKVLQTIGDMVRYAKTKISDINFSAEDASRSERDFWSRRWRPLLEAGFTVINIGHRRLCHANGNV